jgi:hypothetical protein
MRKKHRISQGLMYMNELVDGGNGIYIEYGHWIEVGNRLAFRVRMVRVGMVQNM